MKMALMKITSICALLTAPLIIQASPLFEFKPLTVTKINIPLGGTANVQYQVTNSSSLTHTLKLKEIAGVTQVLGLGKCGDPFKLNHNESCILDLKITGENLKGNINDGPVLCENGSGNLQCYQPSSDEQLNIKYIQSLCDTNDCISTDVVLNNSRKLFDDHFTIVDGFHVGTQEYQEYLPGNVTFVNNNIRNNKSYVQLSATPVADFNCIGRGYVNPYNRAEVSSGTCTYTSGAFYSYRKGFFVNKNKAGKLINHGGIEITLRVQKNDPQITMDELYQKGAWPAVWMMSPYIDDTFRFNNETFIPKNLWPSAMEIDVLELINGGWTSSTPIIGSIHYGYLANAIATSWNYLNNIGDYDRPITPMYPIADSASWHIYGLTWEKTHSHQNKQTVTQYVLSWFYDGTKYMSFLISKLTSDDSGLSIYSAEREVGGNQQLIWCTSSSPRCCTIESNRCNLALDVPMPLTEAEVMFNSLKNGFDSGYYLNVNLAAGGEGIGVYDPNIPGFPPPSFGKAQLQISSIKRFILK